MKKILNKKLDEKAMLAGMFAFASLGVLYLFVSATVNNTQAPTIDLSKIALTTTQTQSTEAATNGMKKYRSNKLKIEFEHPDKYKLFETVNLVALKNGNSTIEIEKQAVNYDDLDKYYNYFLSKRNNVIDKKTLVIGGRDYYEIKLSTDENNSEYLLMTVVNYARYTISTTNPSLFPDLEIIAKSFKILE